MYIATIPKRNSPPAILLREGYREDGRVKTRTLANLSKLATTRWWLSTTLAEQLGVEQADEDELYEAMDWLLDHQASIEKKLASRHLAEDGLALYDLTSSYFEGVTCPLAELGHSRDGKKGSFDVNDARFESSFDPAALGLLGSYQVVTEVSSVSTNFAPASSRTSFEVVRDFTLSLGSDRTVYERGEAGTLGGYVLDETNASLADLSVWLTMTARFGTRRFHVTTDENGYFELVYQPVPAEAGEYTVVAEAAIGEITRVSAPAEFEIRGLYLNVPATQVRLFAGDQQSLRYQIHNLGTSILTQLNVSLSDLGGAGQLAWVLDTSATATTLAVRVDSTGPRVQF